METRLGKSSLYCVPWPLHCPSKPLTSFKKSDRIGNELSASLGKIIEEEANPETEMRG